jgi:hypothetical protein
MTRTQRLAERAIILAIAEADEDLAATTPPWIRR